MDITRNLQSMNSLYRRYAVNNKILDSYEKLYRHTDADTRLLRFAQGSMGTTSDAYILYAIAIMGVATKESISNFLYGFKRLNSTLQIFDPEDAEGLRRRLTNFSSNGIVFRHNYKIDVVSEKTKKAQLETTLMYTIEDEMLNFVNQKLGTRVKLQRWVAAKPLEGLIGWASCSYVASCLCERPELLDFKQGAFTSKACGSVIMPMEVKLNNGSFDTYVAHIPAFLHYNASRQTKEMYEDECLRKILVMRDYLAFRASSEKQPYIVCVCENTTDAEEMKNLIVRTEALLEYTNRIYFTSEGTFRTLSNFDDRYFQMSEAGGGKYAFTACRPEFLAI